MAFTTQQNFTGVLDGTDINELNKKINYKKTKLAERKQAVEEILDNTKFYDEYRDNYFKASINSGDSLSHDNNVFKSLERMANYLLNSDEIKAEEDAEKTQYVFHTDANYFQKKMEREQSMEALTETENGGHTDAIIHFLKREDKNYKKGKNQFISAADLSREDFLGEVLRNYNSFLEFITNELTSDKSEINRYLLTKIKGQLTNDMIYTKDQLLGVWGYDLKSFSESTVPDIDVFDFTNELHLKGSVIETESGNTVVAKGLLSFKPNFDPNNDFSFILLDLEDTIKKAGLTKEEQFVLDSTRNGLSQEEIADELGTYQKKVSRILDLIAKKVTKVGNKYDRELVEA